MPRLVLAILVGKIVWYLSRILQIGGGSAAPGLLALKICPQFINQLIRQIPQNVVITGTNGKTTTARMLAHFASKSGVTTIRNATGSNLERGIASTLISHSHIPSGKLNKVGLGIWELDEAAFNSVVLQIRPQVIIFLNVFRDQLDRYGEVDSVVRKWCNPLSHLDHQTVVLINGDDANIARLANYFKGKVETFGVAGFTISDEAIKAKSGSKKLDFEAYKVKSQGISGTTFQLTINSDLLTINLPLPGIYHIYDFLAAFEAGLHLNFEPQAMINSLKNYSPAFGRVEKFSLTPLRCSLNSTSKVGYIFLIKNPAGATQVFETIAPELKPNDHLLVALNDKLADGTDVSWIWDAQFERLRTTNPALPAGRHELRTICSGTRAQDLAVRLKYSGFNPSQIMVESNLKKALDQAKQGLTSLPAGRQGRLFILPTYTAMLQLQQLFAQMGVKKHYWREE